MSELIEAVKDNDVEKVRKLLENGVDVNCQNESNETAIFLATYWGIEDFYYPYVAVNYSHSRKNAKNGSAVEIVKLLIEYKADINLADDWNRRPIHIACQVKDHTKTLPDSHITILKLLLDNTTDVNSKDKFGETPLHYALRGGGDITIAKLLLEAGADVNIINNNSNTALHELAKQYFYTESSGFKYVKFDIFKYFVENGVDLTIQNKNGYTVLHLLLYKQIVLPCGLIDFLIKSGGCSLITLKDKCGNTTLDLIKERYK